MKNVTALNWTLFHPRKAWKTFELFNLLYKSYVDNYILFIYPPIATIILGGTFLLQILHEKYGHRVVTA